MGNIAIVSFPLLCPHTSVRETDSIAEPAAAVQSRLSLECLCPTGQAGGPIHDTIPHALTHGPSASHFIVTGQTTSFCAFHTFSLRLLSDPAVPDTRRHIQVGVRSRRYTHPLASPRSFLLRCNLHSFQPRTVEQEGPVAPIGRPSLLKVLSLARVVASAFVSLEDAPQKFLRQSKMNIQLVAPASPVQEGTAEKS